MSEEIENLVPKKRFLEFIEAGKWKLNHLGDVGEIVTGKTPSTTDESLWNGEIQFVTPTDISEEKYQWDTQRTIVKNSKVSALPEGSTMFTCIASIGKISLSVRPCITNQQINSVIPNESFSNEFIYYSLLNIVPKVKASQSNTTLPIINKTDFSKFTIAVPPAKTEQQKIADCLSSLDDLITAQNQKVEALKQHKKGLMQQLFPAEGETVPKLRFSEYRDSKVWSSLTLGDISTFYKGKGLPKSAISPDGKTPCIHYGELFTQYSEVIDNVSSKTNTDGDYFLSLANDVLMPTSDVTPKGLAKASCITQDDVVLGGDILVIRTNKSQINGCFLSRLIRHLEREVLQLVSGSTVFHLYASSLGKLKITFPFFEEQQKIADCLSTLDDLITTQAKQLEAYKSHKKGLMQQLFPDQTKAS